MIVSYTILANIASTIGIGLCLYTLHIKKRSKKDENYVPMCNIRDRANCLTALTSEYSTGFGFLHKIVGRNSPFNLDNAMFGLIMYSTEFLITLFLPYTFFYFSLFLASVTSSLVCIYLFYILAFKLKEICVICYSTYLLTSEKREKIIKNFISQGELPENGFDNLLIERILLQLSEMDNNNFIDRCGAGEREGRVQSNLVAKRHFNFAHGIGRSGDILACQPKAAGSSLVNHLTNKLVKQIINLSGITSVKSSFITPMATGMTLVFCMLYLKKKRKNNAKFVIMPRIDQKSCLKSIVTAGLIPIIIEPILDKYNKNNLGLETDVEKIEEIVRERSDEIVCILSTTSCFAPRSCDKIEEISKLSKKYHIPQLVNNAYGIQSTKCCHEIEQGFKIGGISYVIQSVDKNFLVPVGGSVICSNNKNHIKELAQSYCGRASASSSLDKLLLDRVELHKKLYERLNELAIDYKEKLLYSPHNNISIAFTLHQLKGLRDVAIEDIGAQLYHSCVSGARVVTGVKDMHIDDLLITNWGSHSNNQQFSNVPYITFAVAVGMTWEEIDQLLVKFELILKKFYGETNVLEKN
ncbi:hypothetical protein SNEBB_009885 [Seison nebaliae]|nr:hypothetical protein SNEBB_009885 [Seison nebaliae]